MTSSLFIMKPKSVIHTAHRPFSCWVANRWARMQRGAESGMATAEYAIATLAAAGFAGLLLVILRSDEVRSFLVNIIQQALSIGG